MSRSAKKGFFVDEKLMKRINEQNEKNEQRVLKTWSREIGRASCRERV